jgi:hypothetical protein
LRHRLREYAYIHGNVNFYRDPYTYEHSNLYAKWNTHRDIDRHIYTDDNQHVYHYPTAADEQQQGPCPCDSNSLNCSDLNTQPEAQACTDFCISQGAGDIHRLDGNDNDGVACELLPPGFELMR